MKHLPVTVFPSDEPTIIVHNEDDAYGGAHHYTVRNCLGFNNGKTEYAQEKDETEQSEGNLYQHIQFVQKNDDGTVVPGLQNEQLILILIDRLQKLNTRFPARENALAITKLEECLHWLQHRVQARMQRGVMGDLKK